MSDKLETLAAGIREAQDRMIAAGGSKEENARIMQEWLAYLDKNPNPTKAEMEAWVQQRSEERSVSLDGAVRRPLG